MESGLYIVATPIGNLGDLSPRALAVLDGADLVAAEDTRHTRRLFTHHGIDSRLTAYHEHSDAAAADRLCDRIAAGEAVALVSDAGTPLVSDPGYRLVRLAQDRGLPVVPVPGPCAAITALSAAGLPSDRFRFEGFLPAKAGPRAARLAALESETATLVFYEAPHRVLATLEALLEAFGAEREAVLARELSKAFETVRRAPLGTLRDFVAGDADQRRGEIVLLVAGCAEVEAEIDTALGELARELARELPAKRVAQLLSAYSGVRKNRLYSWLLAQED
ncbi:16S rRNA (cytidine(1402)-2'-O)-methyltransferase [Pseudohaliea rubra]|uniref:Ribosomal RNA small subunit methyltransferase I n=1 Tax=Pseudohaliea rubra DSM 19751 TaxID=1265313 RepID=A0A095VQ54_9GAMM|nr:16S rRNA (cytidine(1402)-2'-O)-methyltransferase [Pseudohaliea rubra]KGE03248.1 rRNA small subunit methyltransferase I [Pseudohaliea rubra DSM 19751]